MAGKIIRETGAIKGIDVVEMTSIYFLAVKETQYDFLAEELRKHM